MSLNFDLPIYHPPLLLVTDPLSPPSGQLLALSPNRSDRLTNLRCALTWWSAPPGTPGSTRWSSPTRRASPRQPSASTSSQTKPRRISRPFFFLTPGDKSPKGKAQSKKETSGQKYQDVLWVQPSLFILTNYLCKLTFIIPLQLHET